MKPIIYPYSMASRSGRILARALGTRRVYPDRNYRPIPSHLIINWGCSTPPSWRWRMSSGSYLFGMINNPCNVGVAANKLPAFIRLDYMGINVPRFTENPHEAYDWNKPVMVRRLLSSHSGRGALYVGKDDRELLTGSLADAPLYVEYIKKRKEYRVHVWGNNVIDIQEKRLRNGSEGNDFQVRSYHNGWVFCRDNVDIPNDGISLAIKAVSALGLDFGAVDVVWNEASNTCYVLEVNTAPGLSGSTLESYCNAIKGALK